MGNLLHVGSARFYSFAGHGIQSAWICALGRSMPVRRSATLVRAVRVPDMGGAMIDSAKTTLRSAHRAYLEANGMPPDGGRDAKWVRADIGPIPFAFPNSEGRRRVLLAHDLHHVLTGYGTDLVGEGEVGAWELGSGLPDRTGRRLAIRVFGFVWPRHRERLHSAFMRGRRSTNLVGRSIDEAFLERSVDDVRRELHIPASPPLASDEDLSAYRRCSVTAVAIVWGPLLPMTAFALWWFA
jgi:hypothetical protein